METTLLNYDAVFDISNVFEYSQAFLDMLSPLFMIIVGVSIGFMIVYAIQDTFLDSFYKF